jgi:hypothetical protein
VKIRLQSSVVNHHSVEAKDKLADLSIETGEDAEWLD